MDQQILKCKYCGSRQTPDLVNYENTILGETVIIPMCEGLRCTNSECGKTEINPEIEGRLQAKILEKKLELQQKNNHLIKCILINKVRMARESKDIAQKKIGKALDYSEQRFGAIERNDNTPTIYTALQIADALGIKNPKDLYETVYIPIGLYQELQDLNSNFEVIEGIKEARAEFEEMDKIYEGIKQEQYLAIRHIRDKAKGSKTENERIINKLLPQAKKKLEIIKLKLLKDKNASNEELLKEEANLEELINNYNQTIKENIKLMEKINAEIPKAKKPFVARLEELKKPRQIKLEQLRDLEKGTGNRKGSILRQGYCVEIQDWERILERYGDRLNLKGISPK